MLRPARDFYTLTVVAWDGPVGQITDCYFNDLKWVIRYLVVETGNWLGNRRLLLSPAAVKSIDWHEQVLHLELSREQVSESPPLGAEEPISRQYEEALHTHFNWPLYWTSIDPLGPVGPYASRPVPPSTRPVTTGPEAETAPVEGEASNPHLRSLAEVTGYEVGARDGNAGQIQDFILNTKNWAIFYLVIETGAWFEANKKVLLAPTWVEKIEWNSNRFLLDLAQALIEESPEFDPEKLIQRDYEERLHEHFGRRGYWEDVPEDIS